eukprot:1054907-Amphidinium_carterae.1
MKLHDYFNPATGQWDEAGLTSDLEILRKRKETHPTEPAGADLSNQAAGAALGKDTAGAALDSQAA